MDKIIPMLTLPPLPPPILNEERLDYDLDLCFEYLDVTTSRARNPRDRLQKGDRKKEWRNCHRMMIICNAILQPNRGRRRVLVERARRRAVNLARYNKVHPIEVRLETAILQSLKINKAHVAVREAVEKARSEAMNPEKEPKEKWKPEQQAEATEIEADIETPSQAPGGNGRESDRKADVFVELGFFLKHFVLQLCPPPPYWQALQDRTVGLTELILSSAWRDTRDVMKRSWNPSLPLRPVIVQALDYYMEDRSISRNQADAILAVFDVLPLDQKRTQPPLWGTLDLNNELEQWKLETE